MLTYYDEPTWGEVPQEAIMACSSVESTGPTPFLMTGIVTRLLEYHFSSPLNVINPKLRTLAAKDPSQMDTMKIYVGPAYGEDPQAIQATPALFVKREAVRFDQVSQKNIAVPSIENLKGPNKGITHKMYITGSHSIICKGKTGAEAEALADEVYLRMLNYMSVIRDDFRLGKFMPEGISDVKEKASNESTMTFFAVVRISWAYTYSWLLRLEAPIVKRTQLLYIE
jgi:hypothetical protein